jgi:hypothetical protein
VVGGDALCYRKYKQIVSCNCQNKGPKFLLLAHALNDASCISNGPDFAVYFLPVLECICTLHNVICSCG